MSQADSPVPLEDLLAQRAWVRALALRLVGDAERADDVEQEVWVTALRRPPRHPRSLRAWFARLVRSRARDAYRGESRRKTREDAVPVSGPPARPDEVVARLEAHRKVVVALDELAEPYRTTVLLRYYEDLPPREIAIRTGVPVETVRTRLKRAREMLRRRLDEDHGGDRRAWIVALAPLTGIKGATPAAAPSVARFRPVPRAVHVAAVAVVGLLVAVSVYESGGGDAVPTLPDRPEPVADVPMVSASRGSPRPESEGSVCPEATTPRPPVLSGPHTVTARDLLDGAAIPGMRFRVPDGVLVAGSTGQLGFPDGEIESVVAEDDRWHVPPQTGRKIRESGAIWCYRTVPVSGRVEIEEAAWTVNPTMVGLLRRITGPRGVAPEIGGRWLEPRGVRMTCRLAGPGIDGLFHARIPAIGSVSLTASLPGHLDTEVRLAIARSTERIDGVRILLRAAPLIRGVLRTSEGMPVRRHEIRVSVRGTDTGRVHRSNVRTRKDGAFTLPLPAEGPAVLFAAPIPGHRPILREDLRIGRGGATMDLTFESVPEEPRTRFVFGSEVLTGRRLSLVVLSGREWVAGFTLRLDREGCAPTGLLEPGRRYIIRAYSNDWQAPEAQIRYLDWNGTESEIDLSKLKETLE